MRKYTNWPYKERVYRCTKEQKGSLKRERNLDLFLKCNPLKLYFRVKRFYSSRAEREDK